MDEKKHDPSQNCYCGGPEEIYPHVYGTGYYCKRKVQKMQVVEKVLKNER